MCKKYNIPSAAYEKFTDPESANKYIKEHGAPVVVKADGLAAGKGAIVCQTLADAEEAIDAMLVKEAFGNAGEQVGVFTVLIRSSVNWSYGKS